MFFLRHLLPVTFLFLCSCSLSQSDPIRLAPDISGGWRKDNILVLYSNTYPSTQTINVLISNGNLGWEKIDFKHTNGNLTDIFSQARKVSATNQQQRVVDSYLSIQLDKQEKIKSIAYWYDRQPAVWKSEQLESYKRLFFSVLVQANELKQQKQRLWLGTYDLSTHSFMPCGYNTPMTLNPSDEQQKQQAEKWQKSQYKEKVWLALIGTKGSNNNITMIEQLLTHSPKNANCAILEPIGKPK